MLANYFWNIALAESLYPTIHAVELCLRNSIHETLTNFYRDEEWWHVPRILHPKQLSKVTETSDRYSRKYKRSISPDQVVVEVNFAFWVYLLQGHHDAWIWRGNDYELLELAFPNKGSLSLGDIHGRFDAIRDLRNRVMHHERIFDRPDLRTSHAEMHEAINWISPDLHYGIHAVDSFLEVHELGWERAYKKLHRLLGGP